MIGQVNKLKLEIKEVYVDNGVKPEILSGTNLQYTLSIAKVMINFLHKNLKSGYI